MNRSHIDFTVPRTSFVVEPYFYHAQALERAANLLRVDRFGDHNWRAVLTEEMFRRHQPDGSFRGNTKIQSPLVATCVALMTLSGHPADNPENAHDLEILKP